MAQIYKEEELSQYELVRLAEEVVDGKIMIFKTETIYGIGTNAYNKESCRWIFDIKERSFHKPLLVLISNYDMLEEIAKRPNEIEKKLMDAF